MRRYNPGAGAPYCFMTKCFLCVKRGGATGKRGLCGVMRANWEAGRATGKVALCSGKAGALRKLPVRSRFAP